MSQEINKITVDIFGERLVVRGEGTVAHIQGLAYEVDKKMRIISERLPRLSLHQVAVLAALNFADELTKLREEYETLMELLGEKPE
jgi:cell division protein ZapA